jgi:hypothetical protein
MELKGVHTAWNKDSVKKKKKNDALQLRTDYLII